VVQTTPGANGVETWTWSREWTVRDRRTFAVAENTLYSYEPPNRDQRMTSQSVAKITVSTASMSDADFRLTAFGISEPAGFDRPSRPIYVWLFGAAVVCFGLYTLFRLLAARRKSA